MVLAVVQVGVPVGDPVATRVAAGRLVKPVAVLVKPRKQEMPHQAPRLLPSRMLVMRRQISSFGSTAR